jgi:hypothetical protein
LIREWIKADMNLDIALAESGPFRLEIGGQIGLEAACVVKIGGKNEKVRHVNINLWRAFGVVEPDFPMTNFEAIDAEREQILDNLQPAIVYAGLTVCLGFAFNKIEPPIDYQNFPDDGPVKQLTPFNREIDFSRGEKGEGDVADCFRDIDVFDGIGTADEMDIDVADMAVILRDLVELIIHEALDQSGQGNTQGN